MFKIGTHLSAAKGFAHMGQDAREIGANTFQFFMRNPRGAKSRAFDKEDISALSVFLQEYHFAQIVAHAPYTLNPCSADVRVRELAMEIFCEDLTKMEFLPGNFYNFHPGSHSGQGTEKGIAYIAELLNQVIRPVQTTTVLLETMAGKGTEIGRTFEELQTILAKVKQQDKVGICFDICHLSDAGYDIIRNLDSVLEDFDKKIGMAKLKAVHINDSMNPPGSHKDRHAGIGEGEIGLDAIVRIINHPLLKDLPFILETPKDLQGHAAEIALLKKHRTV